MEEQHQMVPQTTQTKGVPLCLPNNLIWDPLTGTFQKTSDERRKLCPVPAAVKLLQEIKEPVCVVSIAGPCRDGKSYILGEVFGQLEVFPIGHMVDPETMGLWMWIVPQKFQDSRGRDFRVILLDSEGINAVTAEGQNDNQIFTLTVLLASVMIYNSRGVPKRTDLNDLMFIVNLSERIRIRSKGGRDDQELFRNTFPFFFWLLRDVTQKLPSDCRDFNQYFSKRVFKDSTTSANGQTDQQKIAESILSFFSGFESFALPTPSCDDEVMQDISKHRDKLNPKFLEGVKKFEVLLKSKLVPKRSINKGEYVTGKALATLVQLYTDAINDPGAIPNVEMAWDTYVKTQCSEAKKGALEMYDQVMKKQMSSRLPCGGDEILKSHEMAQRKSMETFEVETRELISTIIENELQQLTESIDENLNIWTEKNASETQKSCEDLLSRLEIEHLDPVLERVRGPDGAKVKYVDIMNGWSKIKNEFNSEAVGAKDVMADVFFKFNQHLEEEVMKYEQILRQMKDYDDNLSKEKLEAAYKEKEQRRLEEQLAKLEQQEEAWKEKMETLETRQQEELKLIKDQAKMDKEALDKQMQMMREADMKTQDRLQKQLDAIVEKERQTNKALQEMSQLHEKSRLNAEIMQIKAEAIRIQEELKANSARAESQNQEYVKRMIEKHEEDRARERTDNIKAQTQLQEQLKASSSRESQTHEFLKSVIEKQEEDRARERSDNSKVQTQLQGKLNASLEKEAKAAEYSKRLEKRGFFDRLRNTKPE